MSLMYEVNTLNAAMIQAAEACRQDLPEGEKVNKVLACFAGMKPVEAEPVVHARWVHEQRYGDSGGWVWRCSACRRESISPIISAMKYCHSCGARMDGRPGHDD